MIRVVRPSIALPMRLLCRLLALVAVLLMPLGMSAAAEARSTSHHEMAGMPMGHCPDQESPTDSKPGIAVCTMVCAAALPAVQPAQPDCASVKAPPAENREVRALLGLNPDAADPPPRIA